MYVARNGAEIQLMFWEHVGAVASHQAADQWKILITKSKDIQRTVPSQNNHPFEVAHLVDGLFRFLELC
jgi:hypothetical protein